MMDEYLYEFLKEVSDVQAGGKSDVYNPRTGAFGTFQITPLAWKEIAARYPEKYRGRKYPQALLDPSISLDAGRDYIELVKQYLIYYKLPITIETLTATYNCGISKLVKGGIENIPDDVKYYARVIRHRMQPQAETLDIATQQR
jgi:hypothetical protein